jgi:7-keto-8-aminopelargonate synthetase-like enzyme
MDFISPTDGPYIFLQGKKCLDFSSCDFLGLAQHPEVKKAAIKYILKYGVGIPVAPLGSAVQQQVEGKLAHFLGTEAALFFTSLEELHHVVKNHKATIIPSEGEEARPKKSAGLSCLDESFTLGVTGHQGFGVAAHKTGHELICGSLANSAGCSGAFVAGTKKWLALLPSQQPLSFATLGALDTSLNFIPEMTQERETMEKHLNWLKKQLSEFSVKSYISPRLFLQFKSGIEAEQTRMQFAEDGIYLAPSVDHKLYIALTALHTPDDLDQLATSLKKFSDTDLALSMQSLTPTP